MEVLKNIDLFINIAGNTFTVFASGIAIYLFLFKRKTISSAFSLLLNYSNQITQIELRSKLDRLNDLSTEDKREEVINVFHEIVGQIQGNKILSERCDSVIKKIKRQIQAPQSLTEPKKRSLISELRETIRTLDVHNFDELIGRGNEH